jgi:two-component system, OmpR family, sensor histidine kinase BaeS
MRISLRLRFVLVTMAIAGVTLAGIALFSRFVALQQIERVTASPPRPRRDPESLRIPLLVHWNQMRSWAGVLPLLERLAGDSSSLLLVSAEGHTIAAWPPRTAAGESRGIVLRGAPAVSLPGATLYILPAEPAADSSRPDVRRSVNRSLLFAGLFAFAFALVAALALSSYILRPMRALIAAAARIAEGRLDQRIPQQGSDEIGSLAVTFNTMADRLAHTEQLRRNVVGDISHELRTPLTRMQCQVEAMQDGLAPATPEALRHVHEQIRVLERLVCDLQDLSLSDAGQLKLNPVPLRIDEIICAVAQPQPVALDLAPNLPPVLADARRIRQILQNLIDNALRHGPGDANVTITARRQGTAIEIRVQDHGPGIPPEQLPLIFERFHRLDDARARATGGTGLGLAIVKQLVVAHGGRVWAESPQGEGATLIFTLPTIA